jgi:hypothetical protein
MRLRCALRACVGFALVFPAGFALARADPFAFFTVPLAIFFFGLTDCVMSFSLSSFFEV